MMKHIYDSTGRKLLRTEEAVPECGKDFCDRCGDCLHCDGGNPCYGANGEEFEHFWVEYEEQDDVI